MESHANSQHREILIPQTDPPKVPTAFDELKIPKVVLENLLIKHLAAYPKSDLLALTKLMAISSYMIEDLLASLRKKITG